MQAERVISKLALSSGSILTVYDLTKVYFGDYYHVKLEITGDITSPSTDRKAVYRRTLEKMAVSSEMVETAIQSLLSEFELNSLPYLNSPDFADKFIATCSTRKTGVSKLYPGAIICA